MAKRNEAAKALAKELFMRTSKTIEEIADIVKVNRITVGKWCNEGNWRALKKIQEQTPERAVQDMYAEIEELNADIKNRPVGSRFATSKESDARNKIILSIYRMKNQIALPQYVSVLLNFMDALQKSDLELSKKIIPFANDFLNEMSIHLTNETV